MMGDTFTGGFFYHPDGVSAVDVAKRVIDGTIDPRLDDLFSVAIQETKEAIRAGEKRAARLLARRDQIEVEMLRIEQEEAELNARIASQHEAVAKYQRGEELSDSEVQLLTPACAQSQRPSKTEVEAEFDQHRQSIPEGWEVTGTRMDEDFIYVTMKRERVSKKPPTETVTGKIKAALQLFFAPGFKRESRVRYSDRLGTLSPIVPGAG